MKNITIIAEQISDTALAAAIPARGIASVTVSRAAVRRDAVANGTYRSFRNPNRFNANYRIDGRVRHWPPAAHSGAGTVRLSQSRASAARAAAAVWPAYP